MRGRGPGMLELQIVLKMKDFFSENFGNFWKKIVLRKISGTFVFEKITSTSPPSPPPRRFWGGPGMEGGPNFGIHPPPNRNPVGTALLAIKTCVTIVNLYPPKFKLYVENLSRDFQFCNLYAYMYNYFRFLCKAHLMICIFAQYRSINTIIKIYKCNVYSYN